MKLHELCRAVGITIDWEDATGRPQRVGDESLGAVLDALGYPAGSDGEIDRSLAQIEAPRREPQALLSVDSGMALPLPSPLAAAGEADLVDEDGAAERLVIDGGTLPPVNKPGYYRLRIGAHELVLAVAPSTCFPIRAVSQSQMWGPAVQIPALRGAHPRAFGHFGDLARAAERFAGAGADALAISPVHALYPGDGTRYSPYAPSSRRFLNVALGDPEMLGLGSLPAEPEPPLIDWGTAMPAHFRAIENVFGQVDPNTRAAIDAWAAEQGEALQRHALFNALYPHFAETGARGWQDWPAAFHDPAGPAARSFASENTEAVALHVFAQWLARQGLEQVQERARGAGMALGTIADLAVGVEGGGSDSWGMREALLQGLTIGAPPDLLGPNGQNWGLTTFSPDGLRATGFKPWLEMLRAALGPCGGLRIDHAFGLRRLWVIPAGADSAEGAYLSYPFEDLLRLLALESHRERAIIVAEDLGTIPPGFREAISRKAMLGMRVLWFEREQDGRFTAPDQYDPTAVAMTGTHDTPTVAGWWRGRDIDWNWRLGRASGGGSRQADEQTREQERGKLWAAIRGSRPFPEPDETAPVVDAATAYVARTGAPLVILPLEDVLGLEEQPNLPGTIDEHPNWRRRLPAPLDTILDHPGVATRIAAVNEQRSG